MSQRRAWINFLQVSLVGLGLLLALTVAGGLDTDMLSLGQAFRRAAAAASLMGLGCVIGALK